MDCEHEYVFQSVVYWSGNDYRPGSGARDRYYGDRYYCKKCLAQRVLNERVVGNDYSNPLEGTFPK